MSGTRSRQLYLSIVPLILAVLCLWENLHFFRKCFPSDFNFSKRDGLLQYEKRYEGVRSHLPRRVVIGYLEDIPGNPEGFGRQFTQYALAPALVKKSTAPYLVLNNNALLPEEELRRMGLEILFDAHTGVRLLKRRPP